MAVASEGILSKSSVATSTMVSGEQMVRLESMNHDDVRPDFKVKSPRRTE